MGVVETGEAREVAIKVTNFESSLHEHMFGNRGSEWSRCSTYTNLYKLDVSNKIASIGDL